MRLYMLNNEIHIIYAGQMRFNMTAVLLTFITVAGLAGGSPIGSANKRLHYCHLPCLPLPPLCPDGQHLESGGASCFYCCNDS